MILAGGLVVFGVNCVSGGISPPWRQLHWLGKWAIVDGDYVVYNDSASHPLVFQAPRTWCLGRWIASAHSRSPAAQSSLAPPEGRRGYSPPCHPLLSVYVPQCNIGLINGIAQARSHHLSVGSDLKGP